MLSLFFNVVEVSGGEHVATFEVFDVPPRHGAESAPWTRIAIEEAADADAGPWTSLVNGALEPSPDVEEPQGLAITVAGAALASGWYRVTLSDDAGASSVLAPVSGAHSDLPSAPSLDEVAALMLARVTDADDGPLPTFDDTTNPTAAQVQKIIESVRQEVTTNIVWPIPAKWAEAARAVVAMGTVAYIEQSRHPEAVAEGDSAFSTSRTIFLGRMADLSKAVKSSSWPMVA